MKNINIVKNMSFWENSHWQVTKEFQKKLKCTNTTLFWANLLQKYYFFRHLNQLDNEDGFSITFNDIFEDTCIPIHTQRKCVDKLRALGLLKTKLKCIPAKTFFYININLYFKYIDFDETNKQWKELDFVKLAIQNCEKPKRQYIKKQ